MDNQELKECIMEVMHSDIPKKSKEMISNILDAHMNSKETEKFELLEGYCYYGKPLYLRKGD